MISAPSWLWGVFKSVYLVSFQPGVTLQPLDPGVTFITFFTLKSKLFMKFLEFVIDVSLAAKSQKPLTQPKI